MYRGQEIDATLLCRSDFAMPATSSASSTNRHHPFTSRIWSTVRHATSSSRGLATSTARHLARETATFSGCG